MDEAGVAIRRFADATARLSAAAQDGEHAELYELKHAVQKWREATDKSVLRYEHHQASHTTLPSRARTEAARLSSGSRRTRHIAVMDADKTIAGADSGSGCGELLRLTCGS
ncbi:MAG: hypothetical protein QOJ99_3491 [Bryobacterales bacterium]|jgi:hypothetical protein|nr:hypothetical protein [Bryobacterales bacterium]